MVNKKELKITISANAPSEEALINFFKKLQEIQRKHEKENIQIKNKN